MQRIKWIPLMALQCLVYCVSAQDCTLDLAGTKLDTFIKIFQLNDTQTAQAEQWQAEVQLHLNVLEEEATTLLAKQPQHTPEELTALAQKYRAVQDKMIGISANYDVKLVSVLNEKQYQRYLDLCGEAVRRPLERNPE
ncbi:hypothetical protein U1E44_13360 [Arenibacter sp. GZD96]|uniref:hypothetical protein n=1 Tax=Aurantibrevibacter litoralis TaxID=3106030 RepID=UPI002AFE2B6A|nr:hypothetical protein [Arenibacter sp. GZD-96]MEA1787082.1 hypothetical protein [Arenibacter sp. GZD-96]